jgi:shikimate dehydrogenase
MHNAALRRLGINAQYTAIEARSPREAIDRIKGAGIDGAGITIPLKTGIMGCLDEISRDALEIGAVNTIINDNGRLCGSNTDWLGFMEDLREAGLKIKGRKFAILGAGGAARSVVFGLIREGGIPIVFNRGAVRGEALAREFGCVFFPLEDLARTPADVLVNTTPLGMHPRTEESPAGKDLLPRFEWVIDLVYNPLETRLLREAREAGCKTRSGLGMLVRQGAEQFRAWTGQEPPVELMRDVVESELKRRAR